MGWAAALFFPEAPAVSQAADMQKDVEAWHSQ